MFRFLRWFFGVAPTVKSATSPLKRVKRDLESVAKYQGKVLERNNKRIEKLNKRNGLAVVELDRSDFVLKQLQEVTLSEKEGTTNAGN